MDDDLRALEALFATALYRAACPPAEQLLRYRADLLTSAEAAAVAAHVHECRACQEELALITNPPASDARTRIAAGLATARTLIRATLLPTPAAPALRGAAPRTLTFSADPYQLVVGLIPAPGAGALGQIEGQVVGALVAGLAELLQNDTVLQSGDVDELGFFAFDGVASGAYSLRISFDDTYIVVDDLVL
jgi:hypothetical protein